MHIASIIFESLLKAGGYEVFTFNLLKTLSRQGHNVDLYIPRKEFKKNKQFYTDLQFSVIPLPPKTPSILKRVPCAIQHYLAHLQKKNRYDIWQIMGAYPEAPAALGLVGKVPLVLRTHGEDVQCDKALGYGLRLDPTKAPIIENALRKMDKVIALTPGVSAELESIGLPQDKIAIIPNGINTEYFAQHRDIAAIKAKLGVGDTPLILTVGRNHPKKGYDLIPVIASKIRKAGLDFTWLVVGPETDKLKPDLVRLGLEKSVLPLGPITAGSSLADLKAGRMPGEELVELYCAADVFLFPSRLETFGRVLIEAMAASTPIVTTDAVGCRDVVGYGQYGLMTKVDDTEHLAKACIRLLTDQKLHDDYTRKGLERSRHMDWDHVASEYVSLYNDLI